MSRDIVTSNSGPLQGLPEPQPTRRFKLASEFEPEEVTWLWQDRVPAGKLTIIDGDPGLGKSLVTIALIAAVTTGGALPGASRIDSGGVVLIAPEDDENDTLRPRLEAAGADLAKVIVVGAKQFAQTPFAFPESVDDLREAIECVNAKLVVIDPVMHVLGSKVDSYRDQDVRRALGPVVSLAAETGCAVVLVMHLNKGQGNALYRASGSIGFVGQVRSALRVVVDLEDSDSRVLVHYKGNLSRPSPGLCYTVVENEDKRPCVRWLGESSHSTSELLALSGVASESSQAVLSILQGSDRPLSTKEIMEALGKGDDTYYTVNRQLNRMVNRGSIQKDARGRFGVVGTASAGNINKAVYIHAQHVENNIRPISSMSNMTKCPIPRDLDIRHLDRGVESPITPSDVNGPNSGGTCEHGIGRFDCAECAPF